MEGLFEPDVESNGIAIPTKQRFRFACRGRTRVYAYRRALIEAATSGHSRFFLGTDSAPHRRRDKESACGCAGIYTAQAAIELYVEVFAQADALDRLEAFASFYGADFYGLPRNESRIALVKKPWRVASLIPMNDDIMIPFRANDSIAWQLVASETDCTPTPH